METNSMRLLRNDMKTACHTTIGRGLITLQVSFRRTTCPTYRESQRRHPKSTYSFFIQLLVN